LPQILPKKSPIILAQSILPKKYKAQ